MSKTFTARRAAKKGKLPQGCQTTSPYSGEWVFVIAARPAGCHVELTLENGHTMPVDRRHPIFVVGK